MAKETKEDRYVRTMLPQLTEHVIELKNLSNNVNTKESEIEVWCQSLMKTVLGYSPSNGYVIRSQDTTGKSRFDLSVYKAEKPDSCIMLVEVKKLGADLGKSDFRSGKAQLREYLKTMGDVRWGILTNGYEWKLFDFSNDMTNVFSMDIRDEEGVVETTPSSVKDAAYELLELSASYYESKDWDKLSVEAQALSPDSLAKAMMNADTLKVLSKILKEEHDYKASMEALLSSVSELIMVGLNELTGEWTPARKAEFDKIIRNAKRAMNKTKRKARETKQEVATEIPATAIQTPVAAPASTVSAPEVVTKIESETPAVAVVKDEDKRVA